MNSGKLIRRLGFWDSVAINIGVVIGVGIFRVPAEVAKYLPMPSAILAAWIIGGIISLLGVLCYAELASCFPQTGGSYVYLREAYGKLTAFLFGWIEISILHTGSLAGLAYILAAYLKNFVDFGAGTEKMIAVLAILVFTLINICGLKYGTRMQVVLSTLKVLTLAVMSMLLFTHASGGLLMENVILKAPDAGFSWIGMAPALIVILWTYGGWHESTFLSGEFKDTRKALPWSLIASILLITVLYGLINAAYLLVMPPASMMESKSIAADIFMGLYGKTGYMIMTAAVLISASGALNSYIMTGARIPFALAQDTGRLSWLGTVHARFETPYRALVLNAGWACLLVLWGNFEELLFFTGFAYWLFFTLVAFSVFIHRRRLKNPEAFRMAGYPWVPALFTLVSLALFATTIYYARKAAFLGIFLLFLGIPLYYFLRKKAD